jgi:DNA-binding MarR family transcriptional regulator
MTASLDPERQRVWPSVRAASVLLERAIADDLVRERDFALSEFELLGALVARSGRARISDLGTDLCLAKSNTTRLVDRVEEDGLVERSRDEADARVVHVALTRFGREEYRRVLPSYQRSVKRHVSVLSDSDTTAVNRALGRLVDRLSELPPPPPATPRW